MGYNFLQHFVFSLKLELKLVPCDFALLPPENSRRIGKIYPWRTRLLYDPELLYSAKRVNRFYDEDTGKLLRIHMVICKRFCKSSTYNFLTHVCVEHLSMNSMSKIELRQELQLSRSLQLWTCWSKVSCYRKTRQILLYKSD